MVIDFVKLQKLLDRFGLVLWGEWNKELKGWNPEFPTKLGIQKLSDFVILVEQSDTEKA